MIRGIAAAIAVAVVTVALSSCDSDTPGPIATLAPVPTPVADSASRTQASTVAATPTQADFQVSVNEVTLQLPDSVSFHLEGRGQRPIQVIDIEFATEEVFTCASTSYWSARTDLEAGQGVSVTWEWDMRRRGSIPSGALIWWRWRVVDDLGQEFRTPRQETVFTDHRFNWQSHTAENVTYHWYAGGDDFGSRIANGVRDGLDALDLGREMATPVDVSVYETSRDVRGAVLFAQSWTGGLAFTNHNIILITVDPDDLERDLPGVVHELAHLLVREVTVNCFGDLPTWLNEGLAVYAERGLTGYQQRALDRALANNDFISLRSLSSSFPTSDTGATLSYTLSYSLVDYLIDTYGWHKMRELLAVFAGGAADESAIEAVYGLDYDGLEADWRQSLGLP